MPLTTSTNLVARSVALGVLEMLLGAPKICARWFADEVTKSTRRGRC